MPTIDISGEPWDYQQGFVCGVHDALDDDDIKSFDTMNIGSEWLCGYWDGVVMGVQQSMSLGGSEGEQ